MRKFGLVLGFAVVPLVVAACSNAEASDGAGGSGGGAGGVGGQGECLCPQPLELTCTRITFEDEVIECQEVQNDGTFVVRYAEFDFSEGDEITVCTPEVNFAADQRANRSRCTRSYPSYYADTGQGYVKCGEGFPEQSPLLPDPAITLHRRVVEQGPCCETCSGDDAECDPACIPFAQGL